MFILILLTRVVKNVFLKTQNTSFSPLLWFLRQGCKNKKNVKIFFFKKLIMLLLYYLIAATVVVVILAKPPRHLSTRVAEHLSGRTLPSEVSLHQHVATKENFKAVLRTTHTKIGEAVMNKTVPIDSMPIGLDLN